MIIITTLYSIINLKSSVYEKNLKVVLLSTSEVEGQPVMVAILKQERK